MRLTNSDASLSEVHGSVDTTSSRKPGWKRILSFFGPAYLVSVGYMDPGNWATDLAGGSQFGYKLLWVLLMSNLMALLLQSLSARLGIVQGRDLAQCNREMYPRGINFILYYAPEILERAGLAAKESLFNSIAIGGTNLIFTFVGLYLIDRVGRKTLLFIGSLGYILSLAMVAWSFYAHASPAFLMSFLLCRLFLQVLD
jgi:manganese transport protein